jgi:uncharacterized protein
MVLSLVVAILCCAYFVQAAFAFGGPLIAAPLLSLLVGPRDAVVLTTIFSIVGSILIVNLWKYIDWRKILWLVPSLIVGLIAGLTIFSQLAERVLLILLAGYIVLYVLNDIFQPRFVACIKEEIPARLQAIAGGFGGGFIQGATGIGGGPPVVAYLKSNCRTVDEYRGTYMFTWLAGNLFRLAFMSVADFIHGKILQTSLVTLPFFMISLYAGYYLPGNFSKRIFNIGIDLLLLVTAASILVKYLS